ncbi:MAG: MEDS domain-containing protein [Candidatus Bathyarchaeota archaeon]|nr:MEDS domain-containing protein [Candidatus Bathyarchaeota archaeon]
MPNSDDIFQVLAEFGLTNVQARIYLASVKCHIASVSQISASSQVRKEDVYRSLPKLESLGLIEKTIGAPVKIKAVSIDQAFDMLIKQEQEKASRRIRTLEAKKKELKQHFTANSEQQIKQDEQTNFLLLSKRQQILGKAVSMIQNSDTELKAVYGRNKLMQCLHASEPELKQATQRGVKLRIVSDLQSYNESDPAIIENCLSARGSVEVRYADVPLSNFLVSDFKEALISTNTEGNIADYPCLWTNNHSLVATLHRSFESLWQNSTIHQKIAEKTLSPRILEQVQKLKPTNHAILVYDSIDAKHQVLFTYLNTGLNNHEAVIYVASEETPADIRIAMKEHGIDVDKHEKTGALQILNYSEVYVCNGKFDIEKTLAFWKQEYQKASKTFFGLRVTGEMSCFFKNNLIDDLLSYEKTLHRKLDLPIIAICSYNSKDFNADSNPAKLYTELLQAHGTVFFTALDNKLGMIEIRT